MRGQASFKAGRPQARAGRAGLFQVQEKSCQSLIEGGE